MYKTAGKMNAAKAAAKFDNFGYELKRYVLNSCIAGLIVLGRPPDLEGDCLIVSGGPWTKTSSWLGESQMTVCSSRRWRGSRP